MSDQVDVFVIGGGVNGAGIARDAAGRGLSVIMCEKDDLAEGTSSRSGKLVHGGLRYLEYYEFRLVREALIEREVLLAAAPHIIWPMRFVLPHSPEDRPAWLVRLGLFLYDNLGGRKKLPGTRTLDLRNAPEGRPIKADYAKAFEYSDCWVDDARLVVLNALDAKARGAEILTRTACTSARRENGLWRVEMTDSRTGATRTVMAKALVNASGPWVNDVIGRVAGGNSQRSVRLVKGSHIITKKFWDGPQAYLVQNHDKRVIFINPYEGDKALIGTTDIPFAGAPEEVRAEDSEKDYLIAAVNRYFKKPLGRDGRRRVFLRSAAAVRRRQGQSVRRHARLCVRPGRSRRRAASERVRRQDHHFPQTRRARNAAARALFPEHGTRLDGRRGPAGRRHPRRRFRAIPRHVPERAPVDARRPRASLRPPLRDIGERIDRARDFAGRARAKIRPDLVRGRGPLSPVAGMGGNSPMTFSFAAPSTGCI